MKKFSYTYTYIHTYDITINRKKRIFFKRLLFKKNRFIYELKFYKWFEINWWISDNSSLVSLTEPELNETSYGKWSNWNDVPSTPK